MNRRQQKKQFKKKYGQNPKQVGRIIGEALSRVIEIIKEIPQYVSYENMTDEEFEEYLKQDEVTEQLKIYLMLCRQQSFPQDMMAQEEKVSK